MDMGEILNQWMDRYGTVDKDKIAEDQEKRIKLYDRNYLINMKPEATLDLHGLHQAEAETALDHFITNCAGNIREKRALWLVEYGQRSMIVGDYGGNLTLLEDGYLYYTYNGNGRQSPGGDHLCRILLDGSGWESLNW